MSPVMIGLDRKITTWHVGELDTRTFLSVFRPSAPTIHHVLMPGKEGGGASQAGGGVFHTNTDKTP